MRSVRNNPDSEENARATRENDAYVAMLQRLVICPDCGTEHCLSECPCCENPELYENYDGPDDPK